MTTGDFRVRSTAAGDQVVVRQASGVRWSHTAINGFWVLLVCGLLYWSGPALVAFFRQGEITGVALLLDRFELGPRTFYAAMLGWSVFLAWFGLGGMYEIARIHFQRDLFLLRPDALIVRRRRILTREIILPAHEPLAFRSGLYDGSLEAKTKSGIHTLTDGGTVAYRKWLLDVLQQRYRARVDLPPTTGVVKERIGIYMVEKTPDGVLRIESSVASTFGCAAISVVMCAALITWSVWTFVKGSGGGFVPLIFALAVFVGGISALNRRYVEARRGHLHVRWSSPVGSFLRRFVSGENLLLKMQFGEGAYTRDSGSLRTDISAIRQKSEPRYSIVLLQPVSPDNDDNRIHVAIGGTTYLQDTVLPVHGQGKEHVTSHLLQLLSETTGFPIL